MQAFANILNTRSQNKYTSFGRAFRAAVSEDGKATKDSVCSFVRRMLPEASERQAREFVDYAVSEAGV